MNLFAARHQELILGELTTTDRMVFKGNLTRLLFDGAFQRFLSSQDVLLKDFRRYLPRVTKEVHTHIEALATRQGRPLIKLRGATTRATGQTKENLARQVAARDGITQGLICILSVVEPCFSFGVRGNSKSGRLEAVREFRKCLHYYVYLMDPEFGFIHVRLQSWFPLTVQVYINGREWLARQMDRAGIGYERYSNTFLRIDDLAAAQRLCARMTRKKWPSVLTALARRVNPLLGGIGRAGFGGYFWSLDQCEVSTDVMFRDRAALETILPDLYRESAQCFSADDVMRFLGRRLTGNFAGEVTTDGKRRPEGYRIKHRMKQNSIKLYDKSSVLRVETTINNPGEFKVLRVIDKGQGRTPRWMPMGKGVSNFWRYLQVGTQSNRRYLDALATIEPHGEAVEELDSLCRSACREGRRVAKLNPVGREHASLFVAVLAGEHCVNGFRNRDITSRLYSGPAKSHEERRRRCGRVSRRIRTLRDHGLVAKVPKTRLYRVTKRGYRLMSAAVSFRTDNFPRAYAGAVRS